MATKKELGIVGLGKMGGGMAALALGKGYRVVGNTRDNYPAELDRQGLVFTHDLRTFREELSPPRIVLLSLPAGDTVDMVADELAGILDAGDIICDAGNSYWGDSKRRHDKYAKSGLQFLDLGTSGGVEGARQGPCFMIGGPRAAVETVEKLLKDLAIEGGYVHAGGPGSGHFTKLVHNGIEFGMLQAIGEGMALLKKYPEPVDIEGTLACWQNGSVIRSWLIDLMARSYVNDPALEKPGSWVEDTGEVNWLVTDAMTLDVPVPVIAQAVMALIKSRDTDHIAEKAIIDMRHEFGGHPYRQDKAIAKERRSGRVYPFYSFATGDRAPAKKAGGR